MKFLIQGDLGQPGYHVGDEAMAVAAGDELSRRTGAEIVLLSRDPSQTTSLYGVVSIPTLEFPWPPSERREHLNRLKRALAGDRSALDPNDALWAIMDAVKESDGVVIAGGGNMNSLYGWLLYERAALALIARHFGKPVVVAGQTFGPSLMQAEQDVLKELLDIAIMSGAREPFSLTLGQQVAGRDRVQSVLDDGSFMRASDTAADQMPSEPDFIVATVGPEADRDGTCALPGLARALDNAALSTGLPVYLVPHVGPLGAVSGDADLATHAAIIEQSTSGRLKALPVMDVLTVATVTQAARLVVSNRYHPAVFAVAAGVPVVALALDAYSDVRLEGALQNWGLGAFAVPLPGLELGWFEEAIGEAWTRRAEIAAHLQALRPGRMAEHQQWWDEAAAALTGSGHPGGYAGLSPAVGLGVDSAWARQAQAIRPWFRSVSLKAAQTWCEWDEVRSERDDLRRHVDSVEAEKERILGSKTFKAASGVWHATSRLRNFTGGKR